MYKLHTENWLNPYVINGLHVNNIVFYRAGEVVAETRAGWFGNNRRGNEVAEIEALEFARAIKLNLNRHDHFFIKNTREYSFDSEYAIYINLDAAPEIKVEPLGELVALEDDESVYYGEFFNITATFGDKDEPTTRKEMRRTYSRVVKKQKRLDKEAFVEFLDSRDSLDLNIGSYEAGKIFDNFDEISKFFNNL